MNVQALIDMGLVLVASGKGLWVMNRSIPICNKKFVRLAIPQTEEVRRVYRKLIVQTHEN